MCRDGIKRAREDTMSRSIIMRSMVMVAASLIAVHSGAAQKQYGPGVSDTEIKIGNTMPYSGPASAWGTIGRAEAAYFRMINGHGGVTGRKITTICIDDGNRPPMTAHTVRS